MCLLAAASHRPQHWIVFSQSVAIGQSSADTVDDAGLRVMSAGPQPSLPPLPPPSPPPPPLPRPLPPPPPLLPLLPAATLLPPRRQVTAKVGRTSPPGHGRWRAVPGAVRSPAPPRGSSESAAADSGPESGAALCSAAASGDAAGLVKWHETWDTAGRGW